MTKLNDFFETLKAGKGNWGHRGRPGLRGGSSTNFESLSNKMGISTNFKIVDKIDNPYDADEPFAQYDSSTNTVVLTKKILEEKTDKNNFNFSRPYIGGDEGTILHELAHAKDEGYNAKYSRSKEFQNLFLETKTRLLDGDKTGFPSRRAYHNAAEFFAEGSAAYFVNPKLLSKINSKLYSYLEQTYSKGV